MENNNKIRELYNIYLELGHEVFGEKGEATGVLRRLMMSTHAYILVDSVGPTSTEVCRTAESFP